MSKNLYQQNIDTAFEETVGVNGADRVRFTHWLERLTPKIERIFANPPREAAPIFALPSRMDDLPEIEALAAHITSKFSTLVVAGMGGSSLGGETLVQLRKPGGIKMHFLDNIDPHSMDVLVQNLPWADTAFLFISKSGNTVETLAQMAMLLRTVKERIGADAGKHFFVVTIPNGNSLHTLAQTHGMRMLAHDVNLGGRFSIFSAAGLIPAAVAGLDIKLLRAGAKNVLLDYAPAAQSAALHLSLNEKNVRANVTMHYCDRLGGVANWYRQCWAESLGKCNSVSTPIRSRGATDQHSQLQLYLDGPKDKFFSIIMLESLGQGARIDYEDSVDPRLAIFKGRTLGDLMAAEQRATISTLVKRGCPVRSFMMKELNEEAMGAILMHLTLEVIFTAELLGVNAFDQPAVEEGKVFALEYLSGGIHA